MQPRVLTTVGGAAIALGFVLIALPIGTNEFSYTCYVAAAALILAALAPWFPRVHRPGSLLAYALAGLATLNLSRLLIGAALDLTVFLLLAAGLFGLFAYTAKPNAWTRASILLGSAGALIYLVHDVIVGYTAQLGADTALAVGFTLLWYGSRAGD